MSDIQWNVRHIEDTKEGTGDSYPLDSAGRYTVEYSGKDASGQTVYGHYDILVTGAYRFIWEYSGKSYTVSLEISLDDYIDCKNADVYRRNGSNEQIRKLVRYDDPYIVSLAGQFNNLGASMTELQKANLVLSYVQNIPYMYDIDFNGQEEYWKLPLETILDGSGDCEDTSILFCAIMKAMDYDTAIMTLYAGGAGSFIYGAQNHCVGLVKVDGLTKKMYDGYYFCETTSVGHSVGDVPWTTVANTKVTPI